MVNKPLIRPYFWGGTLRGGWLTSHYLLPEFTGDIEKHLNLVAVYTNETNHELWRKNCVLCPISWLYVHFCFSMGKTLFKIYPGHTRMSQEVSKWLVNGL